MTIQSSEYEPNGNRAETKPGTKSEPGRSTGLIWGSPICRLPGFFGIRELPYLKAGIRNPTGKFEGNSGLKVCTGCGIPRITIGIGRLSEHLGRDDDVRTPTVDQALGTKICVMHGLHVV